MKIDFDLVNQLEKTEIESGSRWVYVADFNIKHTGTKLKSTQRIDVEVEDLKQLQEGGARVVILAHEGRFNDGPGELDFVVSYLSEQLGVDVKYFKENDTFAARNFAKGLQSGDVAIMGNTRKNEGEENGDDSLAQRFSKLGKSVAIGGFGKAHRVNSSNIGILKYLPGYATQSQLREMRNLEGLAGREEGISSVAVLGGIKKEKITIGLVGLIDSYDVVIPGGIVLNTCLVKKFNFDVGDSVVGEVNKTLITTGPVILTKALWDGVVTEEGNRDIVFPSIFFFSIFAVSERPTLRSSSKRIS